MCINFICNVKLLCPVIQFTLDSTIFFIISHISMALYSTDMLFHFLTEVTLTYILIYVLVMPLFVYFSC